MKKPLYNASWQVLRNSVDSHYMDLKISMRKILNVVQEQYKYRNIDIPKTDEIVECDNIDEFEEYQSILRNLESYIYFNSLILISVSSFEYSLKTICYFISKKLEPNEKYKEPYKDVIGTSINYLKKTDCWIEDSESFSSKLKTIVTLRNQIAHHNGKLSIRNRTQELEDMDKFKLLNKEKFITIYSNGQLYINDPEYIISFNSDSHKFLLNIIEKLK